MKLGKDFIKFVEDACIKELVNIGMRKRTRGILTIAIADGFTGLVGLNRETHRGDGSLGINPVIGLRFDPVHKIIADIYGEKPHAFSPSTISNNLGYLIPNRNSYLQYDFNHNEDIEPVSIELANTVKEYGFLYMKKNANISDMLSNIRKDSIWDYSGEYLLVTSYIAGLSHDELHEIVNERYSIAKEKKRNDKLFIDFSKLFFEYISNKNATVI